MITEDSCGCIEKNSITGNIDCNVAIGGNYSTSILVVENEIKDSPGAGIIMVEGHATVSRNDIVNNLDGVRLIESSDRIRRNYIAHNKNDGVVCEG